MKFKIPAEIISKADLCSRNYECLHENGTCCDESHPPPFPLDEKSVLLRDSRCPDLCPYRRTFGRSVVCRCPVRITILHQYGI